VLAAPERRYPSGYNQIKGQHPWVVDDVALAGLLAMRAGAGFDAVSGRPDPALVEHPLPEEQIAMYYACAVFCLPRNISKKLFEENWPAPKAIQPSWGLLEDFKDAHPPRATQHLKLLREYTWYIDIPKGSLQYDDESEIRVYLSPIRIIGSFF
jgi:hypothetical protein